MNSWSLHTHTSKEEAREQCSAAAFCIQSLSKWHGLKNPGNEEAEDSLHGIQVKHLFLILLWLPYMLGSLLTPQQCLNNASLSTLIFYITRFLPVYTLNVRAQAFMSKSQTSFSYFSHSNILLRMLSKDTQVGSRKHPPLPSCSASHIS